MQKIPTLFVRDPEDRRYVLDLVTPGCEWVAAGEGVATRKYDGTCVMFDGAAWWARREVKPGKTPPSGFRAVSTDGVTGRTVGWEPVGQSSFAKFHSEALANIDRLVGSSESFSPGTYELIGPKINGNPEGKPGHWLVAHAEADVISLPGRTFEELRATVLKLAELDRVEGLVFHHPDGRMAKIKARDFPA
ncbi:RNA ligase 1 family protein [Streptomyces sp. HUAS TT7]|uniref:RNA ligase 1 family protein n=1 Tax=Streptomyces sp. HUAS TT7 TaxID=3447507 RepID=UPI003F656E13